jgi:hypothetical protein
MESKSGSVVPGAMIAPVRSIASLLGELREELAGQRRVVGLVIIDEFRPREARLAFDQRCDLIHFFPLLVSG